MGDDDRGAGKIIGLVQSKYIAQFDEAELTLRLIEAMNGVRRPQKEEGKDAASILNELEPEMLRRYRLGARAAMDYFSERVAQIERMQ